MVKDLRVLPQLLLHASRISGLMSHRFPEKPAAAKRLRGFPEVPDLCVEGALERGPRRAALDIGGKSRLLRDDFRA